MKATIAIASLLALTLLNPQLEAEDSAKAERVIKRAIAAIGGDEALAKTRHTIVEDRGTYFGMGDGLPYTGRYVMSFADTLRYRMEILGQFILVVDGDKAWSSFMGTTVDLDDVALDAAKEGNLVAYAISLLPFRKPNADFKLAVADQETIDGEVCDVVKVDRDGMPTLTIWFSTKTGLIKKTKYKTRPAELGFQEVDDETIYHEYGEFDGVKSPIKLTIYRAGEKFVESAPFKVAFPAKLDESEFKKPE